MDSDHLNDAVDSAIHMPLLVYINGAVETKKELRVLLLNNLQGKRLIRMLTDAAVKLY